MLEFKCYLNGDCNEHAIIVTADAGYADAGIGPCEYWGATGIDRRIGFECDIAKVEMVHGCRRREIVLDDRRIDDLVDQIREQVNDIAVDHEEWIADHCENY